MSDANKSTTLPPELERRIERAEAAVAVLKPKFERAIETDIERLNGIASGDLNDAVLEELRRLVHDLKGTAGGFGFNLVSDVAACFSAYLDVITALTPRDADIIRDHANSIAIALNEPLLQDEREKLDEFLRLSQQLTTDAAQNR